MKVENSRYPLKRFIKSRLPMVAKAAREVRVLIKSDRSVYGSEPFTRLNADALFSDYVFEKHNFDPRLHADKKRYLLTDVDVSDPVILGNCTRIGSIDEVPDNDIAGSLFYVYFQVDSDAYPHIRKILNGGGLLVPPLGKGRTSYRFTNKNAREAIRKTWANEARLSHMEINVQENICEALEVTRHLEGDYVEIGVYKGTSAFTALNYMALAGIRKHAWLLDTFNGFDYAQARCSSDAIWKDTHQLFGPEKTMRYVSETLDVAGHPYTLVRSNVCEEALPAGIGKISVANVDVDIYEATRDALLRVAPLMVPGGIIVCEDPPCTPMLYGAYVALREFLEMPEGRRFMPLLKGSQYYLVNIGG